MRDIKIRAWNNIVKRYSPVVNLEDFYNTKNIQFQNLVFEMFTGRKDKNNREIFEGDIIKFDDHSYYAEVEYCSEFAAFLFQSRNVNTINNPDALMYWTYDIEIVGNVHQHKHLLTKPKTNCGYTIADKLEF